MISNRFLFQTVSKIGKKYLSTYYYFARFGRRDHLVRHLKKAHASEAGWIIPDLDGDSPMKSGLGLDGTSGIETVGPSEETIEKRLEGHSTMVSELLQSVAKSMVDLPTATIKSEHTPKKRLPPNTEQIIIKPDSSGMLATSLGQYLTLPTNAISVVDSKGMPTVILPDQQQGAAATTASSAGAGLVGSASGSGFIPPLVQQPSQQQQVAAIMTNLGHNLVQVADPRQLPTGISSEALTLPSGPLTLTLPAQALNSPSSAVMDILTAQSDEASAVQNKSLSEKLSALQRKNARAQLAFTQQTQPVMVQQSDLASAQQAQQGHVVSYSDAMKLASISQISLNTTSKME